MGPVAATSFDVAIWFLERARAEDTYLQPRKLQCLLFLAQAHFAAAYEGRRLMPSVFVVDHAGPIDPNLYRAFEHGRPVLTETPLPQPAAVLLDAIWRHYGGFDTGVLNELIAEHGAADPAIRDRDGKEVGIEAMRRMFAKSPAAERGRPRLMRSHTGRPVTVQKWVPGQKPAA